MGLVTIIYCLRFETSIFVASYDSQGYGGGIGPRLHTRFRSSLLAQTLCNLGTDGIENTAPNSYSIVARVRVPVLT
jgi:hypothetical protein